MEKITVLDIETAGLDAQDDWITCVGVLDPEEGVKQFTAAAHLFRKDPYVAEKKLLYEFFEWFRLRGKQVLITYNGEKFDLPFIITRAEFHEYTASAYGFPSSATHIDMARFVKHSTNRMTAKDTAARNLTGIYVPSTSYGSFLARIYKHRKVTDEQHMEMLQHNAIDLVATIKMHGILKEYDDFEDWLLEETSQSTLEE